MRTWLIGTVVLSVLGCRASSLAPTATTPPPTATPTTTPPPPPPTATATPTATPTPTVTTATTPAAGGKGAAKIAMAVTEEGFVPERVPAKKGQPVTLAITRKTDKTCAREIVFQGQEGKTALPLGKTVEVTYTPKASGEIKFGCAMGMMVSGVLMVD